MKYLDQARAIQKERRSKKAYKATKDNVRSWVAHMRASLAETLVPKIREAERVNKPPKQVNALKEQLRRAMDILDYLEDIHQHEPQGELFSCDGGEESSPKITD